MYYLSIVVLIKKSLDHLNFKINILNLEISLLSVINIPHKNYHHLLIYGLIVVPITDQYVEK